LQQEEETNVGAFGTKAEEVRADVARKSVKAVIFTMFECKLIN
jgi:hypothetical protein